eukprot:CAMPEP_0197721962 /NCGR_PEP_ID=MMETSP1434-20131217/4828_1 /TAXON_ID=265543 /ORGANISM="Minutocellus polymorphus, Strain CCMP3303" /LENGTH=212 /DNA_ID=CAMNT_0043307049 /DNA_START=169 /DNA_END=807 /DNA_ORIENTATION=+
MTLTSRQHHPTLRIVALAIIVSAAIAIQRAGAFSPPLSSRIATGRQIPRQRSQHFMSDGVDGGGIPEPTTFREAEVIGLRFMQEGRHEDALTAFKMAMKLPGSRPDVVRTKTLSGPSPVGGSQGGTEGKLVMGLDEFELQAAHYNMACAFARLGNIAESVANLKSAFDYGFDNYATVRSDPDLGDVHPTPEFEDLMNKYDKRFPNPLNMFRK